MIGVRVIAAPDPVIQFPGKVRRADDRLRLRRAVAPCKRVIFGQAAHHVGRPDAAFPQTVIDAGRPALRIIADGWFNRPMRPAREREKFRRGVIGRGWRKGWYECPADDCDAAWSAKWSGGGHPVVRMTGL